MSPFPLDPITPETVSIGVLSAAIRGEPGDTTASQANADAAAASAAAAAASAATVAGTPLSVGSVNGAIAAQTLTTAGITLPSGSVAPVAVTINSPGLLAVSTSAMGTLGATYGRLIRAAGGSYTFAPAVAPGSNITVPTGTLFRQEDSSARLNPLLVGNNTVRDEGFDDVYLEANLDASSRLLWGLEPDGTNWFPKLRIGQLAAGPTGINAPGVAFNLLSIQIASGAIQSRDSRYSDAWLDVDLDAGGRLLRGVRTDGTTRIPKLDVGAMSVNDAPYSLLPELSAAHAADGAVIASEQVGSALQIVRYNGGARSQLTTIGSNNYNPVMTAESPQRILFTSTRTGTPRPHVINAAGTEMGLAVASRDICLWGDSMTFFLEAFNVLPGKLGTDRNYSWQGVGAQSSTQIGGRQGGLATTVNITGASIPTSGAVGVTGLYPRVVSGAKLSLPVTIQGVRGTLAVDPTETTYTFTRATAGSAVAVSNPVAVEIDRTVTFSGINYNMNELTQIFWNGRNGVVGSFGETDISIYTAMIAKLINLRKRVLILSIFNGGYSNESNGDPAVPTIPTGPGANYTLWTTINNGLAAAFPNNYYDLRRDFIDGAEAWLSSRYPTVYASDWGLPFTVGDVRTGANLGPNSSWDVANDVPPRAMRADIVHLNAYGCEFAAELIAARINLLGW